MEGNNQGLYILSESEDQQEMLKNSEPLLTMQDTNIMDVYACNFVEELTKISKLVNTFNCISMDTEFPGYTTNPPNNYMVNDETEYEYFLIRNNVNNSKIIQIGFTLSDQHGRVPQGVCTWQFNFEFLIEYDAINGNSKDLLIEAGIDFNKLKEKGIDVKNFAEYWVASGIALNKKIKWIVFHGSYDFAYLLRIVHGDGLPNTTEDFYRLMRIYYPSIYDIKYFIKDIPNLKDVGLNKLGTEFGCLRIGPQHQAGSDSLLTLRCYFKLKEKKETQQVLKNSAYLNVIYGVGKGYIKSSSYDYSANNSNSNVNMHNYSNYNYTDDPSVLHHQMPYYYGHPQEMYYYYPTPYGYS